MLRFLKGTLVFILLLLILVLIERYLLGLPVREKIAIIKVDGVITEETRERVVGLLKEAEKRLDIPGVLIYINSPGGSVVPAQEIYDYVMRIKKKKPVYCYISSIGASGAYYIASSCDRIYAQRGSLVGSIGVIFSVTDLQKLMDKIGLKIVTVKSGKYKDTGSPFKPLTDEEKEYIRSLIMDVHKQFIEDVAKARRLSIEKVEKIADGRVFTGTEALELSLVDAIGSAEDAVYDLSRRLGYKKPLDTVILERKRSFVDKLLEQSISSLVKKFIHEITENQEVLR